MAAAMWRAFTEVMERGYTSFAGSSASLGAAAQRKYETELHAAHGRELRAD